MKQMEEFQNLYILLVQLKSNYLNCNFFASHSHPMPLLFFKPKDLVRRIFAFLLMEAFLVSLGS